MSDGTIHSEAQSAAQPADSLPNYSRLRYVAIACGAIPLVVGSLIYWTWRVTRWDSLPIAGLATILVGFAMFLFGAMCALSYVARESKIDRPRRVPLPIQLLLIAALLLANFPAAIWYARSATELMSVYMVSIVNQSEQVIDSFRLRGGGVDVDVGPISVGGRATCKLQFQGDGQLTFSATQQNLHFDGTIEEYVTVGLEGLSAVYVKPNGKIEVVRVL